MNINNLVKKIAMISFISLFSLHSIADKDIFNAAQDQLNLNVVYINAEYDSAMVGNFCPKQSIGCYVSADRGRVLISKNVPKEHHNVVLLGLYSDYIQHSNTGLIDSSLTCGLKVDYLEGLNNKNLVNLYKSQCEAVHRNKVVAMN